MTTSISFGEDAELHWPLPIAIIFGLSFATLLIPRTQRFGMVPVGD